SNLLRLKQCVQSLGNQKVLKCFGRFLILICLNLRSDPRNQITQGGIKLDAQSAVWPPLALEKRRRTPGEEPRGDDFDDTVGLKSQRLALQANEANSRQLAARRAINLHVGAAEIQNQLDARIRSNLLDTVVCGVFLLQDPQSLHMVLKDCVRD